MSLKGRGQHASTIFKVPAAVRTPGPLHVPVLRALVEHCKMSNCKFSKKEYRYRRALDATAGGLLEPE